MYNNTDLDLKYTNETILINFNKKCKFNLNIVKNFKGFYNDLILLMKNNNNIEIIKNYTFSDELYTYFKCYHILNYYIIKKKIVLVKNGFIFNGKFENIQLIDFFMKEYKDFIKIIKLLLKYRYKNKIIYQLRHVNIDFISMKVINNDTYKTVKFLLKNKLIFVNRDNVKKVNYYKQNNTNYYFKKILKYINIDIQYNKKVKMNNILITQKSLKNKKKFDKMPKVIWFNNSIVFNFYKKNNYFKNVKYIT